MSWTPQTWQQPGPDVLGAADCAGVQRAQAAAPGISNTAREGFGVACLKPAPVHAVAAQLPSRSGSAYIAQAGAELAGRGSVPAAGDLRGACYRCSRCGRDMSSAGFAQRVAHIKKCAAAAAAAKEAREAPLPLAFLPFLPRTPMACIAAQPAPTQPAPALRPPTGVRTWLGGLGLGRHADAFEKEEVDMACLPVLTAADLLELGVVEGGERQRILAAAAALRSNPAPAAVPPRFRGGGGSALPAAVSGAAAPLASSPSLGGASAGGGGEAPRWGELAAPGLVPRTLGEQAAQLTAALAPSLGASQRAARSVCATESGHAAPGSSEFVCCGALPRAEPATVYPAASGTSERASCGALPAADSGVSKEAADALRAKPGAAHAPARCSAQAGTLSSATAGALSSASAGAAEGTAAAGRAAAVTAPRLGPGSVPSRAPRQPLGALGALMAASRQRRASNPAAAQCASPGEYCRYTESALLARLCPAPRRQAPTTGAASPGSAAGWQVPMQAGGRGVPAAGLLAPSALASAKAGHTAGEDWEAGVPCRAGSCWAGVGDAGSLGQNRGSLWAIARDTRPHLPQAAGLQARVRKRKAAAAAAAAAQAGAAGPEHATADALGSQGAEPSSLKQARPWHGYLM